MNSFAYLCERFPSFVQTFVYREAAEMVRRGMEPWLVSIRRPDDPVDLTAEMEAEVFYLPEEKELRAEVDAWRAAGKLGWRARRAISARRGENDSQRIFEAVWLAPRLRERGVRHVHAHFGGMAARTAWWLRKLFGISYSFTGHANDIFCATDFPVSNADLVAGAQFIVTETDHARRWMEEKYPSARGRIFRVFNGISLEGFPPRAPTGGATRILSVGRYVEKKGFGDLIEACRLLRERGATFVCEIVGGGPLEGVMQEQIDAGQLGECVKLLGPRPQSEVRRLLAQAHVFVLACVVEAGGGSDNLPTVIMEAMVAGVPVISTRVAGVPEMITDGQDGLLVPPNNPAALADAINRLAGDPVLASHLSAQAQRTAAAKFAVETTTRELQCLLLRHGVSAPDAARRFDATLPRTRKHLSQMTRDKFPFIYSDR
ncbi:MAG: glycosyltransferase family 4 protein [Chthoniobacter sp.]|nr:glycosyltransferase family 4 protein [Chthoniobacter sp.]